MIDRKALMVTRCGMMAHNYHLGNGLIGRYTEDEGHSSYGSTVCPYSLTESWPRIGPIALQQPVRPYPSKGAQCTRVGASAFVPQGRSSVRRACSAL